MISILIRLVDAIVAVDVTASSTATSFKRLLLLRAFSFPLRIVRRLSNSIFGLFHIPTVTCTALLLVTFTLWHIIID